MSINVDVKNETIPLLSKSKPTGPSKKRKKTLPPSKPSFFSSFTFDWMSDSVYKAYNSRLSFEDIQQLHNEDQGETNSKNLTQNIEYFKPKNLFTFVFVVFYTFWKLVVGNFFLNAFSLSCVLISPFFVQQLLTWFQSEKFFHHRFWYLGGYGWVLAILSSTLIGRTVGISVSWFYWLLYIRIKSALIGVTYQKCLKVSSTTVSKQTTGKLVNIVSVDSNRMANAFIIFNMLFIGVFQISACIGLLLYIIGYVTFVGLGVILLLAPVLFILLLGFASLISPALETKDKRISIMNELLQNIKNIKFFSWEMEYEKKVQKVRDKELIFFRVLATLGGSALSIMSATPTLITVTTMIVFSIVDKANFKPEIVFPAMSYFILLKYPLFVLPYAMTETIQIFISAQRILKFLNTEDLPELVISFDLI
jgi:ATP-binding cassette, subfamily C (CFTR/MRP), member 1